MAATMQLSIRLGSIKTIGPFQYRWPKTTEQFARGWECHVLVDDRPIRVRHGLGSRYVYGRIRIHGVTWVNGWPSVEGVEADDYAQSRSLLSLLRRPDMRLVITDEDIPVGYDGFVIVNYRDNLEAPYSRNGLAVKIVDDNIAAWASHAAIRAVDLERLPWSRRAAPSRSISKNARFLPDPIPRADAKQIVAELIKYGARLKSKPERTASFTPDPLANDLILRSPFAFLLAVLFDQGIPAERAWQAPYELQRRLGHLDPRRIAVDSHALDTAMRGPPSLHRFVAKVSGWVVAAARKVVTEYNGDAGAIWSGEPTAEGLQADLRRFSGIGQKKAAMAVEILQRDLGVPIRDMKGSDVAYDVHVRRVFLRTGLAERDDLNHIIAVARKLYPEQPGKLDFPAWRIGRTWCSAGTPQCESCVLHDVCPKEIYRAEGVRGI